MSEETNTTEVVTGQSSTEVQTDSDSTLKVDTQDSVSNGGVDVESSEEQTTEETETPEPSLEERYGDYLAKIGFEDLTKEDYKALAEKGISRLEADLLAKTVKEDIAKNDVELFNSVGGESAYREIQEYAMANIPQEDLIKLDQAVRSDVVVAKLVAQGIRAMMLEQQGYGPSIIIETGNTQTSLDNNVYRSREDYFKDKLSKEYKMNPDFKRKVDARRNASGF